MLIFNMVSFVIICWSDELYWNKIISRLGSSENGVTSSIACQFNNCKIKKKNNNNYMNKWCLKLLVYYRIITLSVYETPQKSHVFHIAFYDFTIISIKH